MDIRYRLHGIQFEWDGEKVTANLGKHGVSFEAACEVFFDPFVRVVATEDVDGELRAAAIGLTTGWHLLYVVYVMGEETVRLISARPATRMERKAYEY